MKLQVTTLSVRFLYRQFSLAVLALGVFLLPTSMRVTPAGAQMINTTAPFNSVSDSFYENHGVNFGFALPGGRGSGSRIVGLDPLGNQLPNLRFSQGGAGAAIPPFGGYNPATAGTFGFGVRGPNGGGYSLGLTLAKGRTRQSITTAPSLTTQNGFGGSMSSGAVRPFVTGVIPIVGHGGSPIVPMSREVYMPDNGVTRAMGSGQLKLGSSGPHEHVPSDDPLNYSNPESTATSGDLSVKAIKAKREKQRLAELRRVESVIEDAQKLADAGKLVDARIKFREALGQTDDDNVKARIKSLIQANRQ